VNLGVGSPQDDDPECHNLELSRLVHKAAVRCDPGRNSLLVRSSPTMSLTQRN
jgi:hypothetical protein